MNHQQFGHEYPLPPQRIAVSGSSGLVGSELCALLERLGHKVDRIVRGKAKADVEIAIWDPSCDPAALERLDAVIHLAGKPIAAERWNEKVKQAIRESRVEKTRELAERLAQLDRKPKTLLCASATGIYGDRGNESVAETTAPGGGFLADVAEQWEGACRPASDAGIRTVQMRFGMILSRRGGALPKMIRPTKLGLGGVLGSGRQWWSWIALDDTLGGIYHLLARDEVSGPVNFVAPVPVRNREFAKRLGKVLHRPAVMPAPAFALRIMLGEMADSLLLASARVSPEKLLQSGYHFRFPTLEPALRHLLDRPASKSVPLAGQP